MNSSEWMRAITAGGFGSFLMLIFTALTNDPLFAVWSAVTGFLTVLVVLFLVHWLLKWNEKRPKDFFEKLCPHWSLRWVGDAWDTEYICRWCGKRWFNEHPSSVKWSFPFEWNGKRYRIINGKPVRILEGRKS